MTHRPKLWSLTILVVLLAVLAAACSDVSESNRPGGATGNDGRETRAGGRRHSRRTPAGVAAPVKRALRSAGL